MDDQKIPSCSQETGKFGLEEKNQVLKPPPRRKKSLRKTKMESDNARKRNTSSSGKTENEQLNTSLDNEMVKGESLHKNIDKNNKSTVVLGDNLDVDDIETLNFEGDQQYSIGSKTENDISDSPARNKNDNEGIEESKAGETPEGLCGCKMTTIKDEVSKIQKRNMKENESDEIEEGQNTMGNKNGAFKSKTKNTDTNNPGKTKVIQNGKTGIIDSPSGSQTKEAVVANENFESNFCLVDHEKAVDAYEEHQTPTTFTDQNSSDIPLQDGRNSSQRTGSSEECTSGISTLSENLNYSMKDPDSQNNIKCVNNVSHGMHDNSAHDATIIQVGNDFTSADKKDMMFQLQNNENNTTSDNHEVRLQNNPSNLTTDSESQDKSILSFQNPSYVCTMNDFGIKTGNIEEDSLQQQCNDLDSTDINAILDQEISRQKENSRISKDTDKSTKDEKLSVPYQHLEDSVNQDTAVEGDLVDDEDYSSDSNSDSDSDTYYSDFTTSEGEYDMEDAEKFYYTDDAKIEVISLVSKEAEPESIEKILSAFQDTDTLTVTDDTDGESHGDGSHGDGSHSNEASTGFDLSEDRAQSLRRKIGSFKVVKGVEPVVDKVDVKEASVGMTTEFVAMETGDSLDTTKTAELAILALHKEHRQKYAERKEREREKRRSQEVLSREKPSEKLEISRPRSIVGEPRTRSRSTGDLQDEGKQKPIAKKQYSLPPRPRSAKLSELDFDEREELSCKYSVGLLKGGVKSLSHLEDSRERRESGSPLFKQSSNKGESKPKIVTLVESSDGLVTESVKKETKTLETPSIALQQVEIPESEAPPQIDEAVTFDDDLTTIIQVDESPILPRPLSTVTEESSSSLESAGSFSMASRVSSISEDKKPITFEGSKMTVGLESENTPTNNNTMTKLQNWELENGVQDERSQIEKNQHAGPVARSEAIDITPDLTQEGRTNQDQVLSNSAPTISTSFPKTPSGDNGIKNTNCSVDSVNRRQMKITREKRKWLSQSAVVTSSLPQSPTNVKLTGFRKNGEPDFTDSGALDLQISNSPEEDKTQVKTGKPRQVSFDVAPDVTPESVTPESVTPENVTPEDVTPKRPPRKGKLSPSASFASPRTTRANTEKKITKRENAKRREGGSRWQTLSGAIDADWLARLSSANKLPTEQMSEEIITLVTDAIPSSFPSFPTDKRAQIALELYTTERTYVRGLEIVIELFKNQLEDYLEPKEKATMFSNIDEIFKVNKDVLFSLCEKVNHWKDDQVIGDIFVDNGDRFKIYATYCNNYDAAENLIKQKIKKKKEFEDFLEACYKNVVCQPGLKLPAYLITVVQRIPRYLLLLRDLVKCTPATHADARPIKEGLRKMNNIAEYINNQLQAVQGQRAMTELRSRVIGIKAFETAGKSLIKEGEVYIMSTKRTYKCLLFNDMVVFAAKNVNKRSEVELTLELESIWVADLDDNDPQTSKEDAIELYTPERSYTMYTGTRNEKKLWLQKLRTAIAIRLHGEMATDSTEIAHRKCQFTYKDGRIYCGIFVDAKRHGHGVLAWPNRTRYVGNFEDDERNGIGELTYSTGEKYNGEWLDDKQNGVGTLTYPNKDIYTGEWKRGKMNGKGLINFNNEDILEGEFVDNEVCGIARLTCVSGLTYQGTWMNSKKHGKGKLVKPNGDTYEGDFSNDRFNGTGTMIYANNEAQYEGQWENNQRHGTGIYTVPDGMRYEGEWRGDHMSGRGKMLYPNGETYDGSWYKDMRFGKGILCCQEGIYEGKFEYNVCHGYGSMRYKDSAQYEGEWQHDQRHGQGRMIYADSSIYEGNWMLGLCNGRGKMTYSNGATYEGNWDLGSEHGADGVFIDPDNNYSYEGYWEYGSRQGQGVERTSSGTYEGDFKANMRHGKGVETLKCGTVYEGHWRDNRKVGEVIRRTRWGETETTTELQYWKEGQLLNKDETIAPDLPFIQRITNK